MGLDYSSHPVDPALFRERLVPYAMGRGDISDLIERGVQLAVVRERTIAWSKAAYDLSKKMREDQKAVAPIVKHRVETPGRRGLIGALLGQPMVVHVETHDAPARAPGMPGFDTDLTIWGRPFFNTAAGGAAGIAAHQSFMALAGQPPAEIDPLCRRMVADLDSRRSQIPPDTHPVIAAAIAKAPPYVDAIKVESEELDMDLMRKGCAAQWIMIRKIWEQRDAREVDIDALERAARVEAGLPEQEDDSGWADVTPSSKKRKPPSGRDAVGSLPLRLAGFAADLEPGWMGRGDAYASSAFRWIKVDSSHIFETPAHLFEEMVTAAPKARWFFRNAIYDNFSLGGYVRPEKVPLLIRLLEENKDKLIRAWARGTPTAFDLEDGLVDYLKNLEPAMYAAEKGWGYLEAAEIYSGFLGWSN